MGEKIVTYRFPLSGLECMTQPLPHPSKKFDNYFDFSSFIFYNGFLSKENEKEKKIFLFHKELRMSSVVHNKLKHRNT